MTIASHAGTDSLPAMRSLVVFAHPLPSSLTAHLARHVASQIETVTGAAPDMRDLYAEHFDPVLSPQERRDYYTSGFEDRAALSSYQRIVLVFPTWWFGPPAILKGWIERNFLPGIAYDPASDMGALTGRLTDLTDVLVITTLGSPWWVDRLVMRRPVARALKWGVFKACAPKARFAMLSLYQAETVNEDCVTRFFRRINRHLETWT